MNCNGSGTYSGVIDGINWVKNNASGPSVANMSLGGGASQAVDDAVNAAVAAGVSFVVAAGNDNGNACNYSPARAADAITVGSTTSSDARSSFQTMATVLISTLQVQVSLLHGTLGIMPPIRLVVHQWPRPM